MLRAVPATLLAAALAVSGCGGPNREEAVSTAEAWLRAVGDRDVERACALMHESAVDALRARSGLEDAANCVGVVRVYANGVGGDVDGILEIGLEAEGTVKGDELGVFPVSGPRELQVILMRHADGEWKVASTTIGPSEPEPTPDAG